MGESRRIVLRACLAAVTAGLLMPPALGAPAQPRAQAQSRAAPAADRRTQTKAQLQTLQAQIAAIRDKVSRDAVESDRLAQELQVAEVSVAGARAKLEDLRGEHAERTAHRASVAAEKNRREAEVAAMRTGLAQHPDL